MSIFRKKNSVHDANDAALVLYSLGGDRDAFCTIVIRYQNLLCSLAYSSVGDIKYSEDIAQEAFVEAWKKLDTLKDPEKLKSWLCGILRFKVSHFHRKEQRQPVKQAVEITDSDVGETPQIKMEDEAILQQEQKLLWKTLESLDDTYKEPLILFYREQQSVERVASELDLSVDTAKQRLSRGRKLLKSAMSTFVEDALSKSKPGASFTAGVLAATSLIAPPSKAAVFGAGVIKTGSIFNLAAIITIVASFSGVISSFFGLRASLDQSRTVRERKNAVRTVALFFLVAILYVIGVVGLRQFALSDVENKALYSFASQLVVFGFITCYLFLVVRIFEKMRQVRAQERIFNPQAFLSEADQQNSKQREYKSQFCLLGAPLLHFQFGMPEVGEKPAFGWIAGGSHARGLLFAYGGIAIAPISVGIVSFGVISIGAVGFGIIGLGTVGIGILAFGASAIAYKAYGSLSALGWESAFSNGFSIANDAAIGPIAFAVETNNEKAAEIVNLVLLAESYLWVLAALAMLVIIPSAWHSIKVRKRMGKSKGT